jgi:hypothetical protein
MPRHEFSIYPGAAILDVCETPDGKPTKESFVKLPITLCIAVLLSLTAAAQDTRRGSVPEPPKGPTPKAADGHPDLTGYWRDDGNAHPHGNIGKDLPGFKLPFTAAGEAAHKYNVEHTIDPESRCLPGSIPREDAGDGGFQLLQVQGTTVFLYQYGTFRLIPTDGRKHTEDPDPTYFGEEIGSWDGNTFVIDSTGFKDVNTWADENADPVSEDRHVVERWTRPDLGHLHLELLIEDPKFYNAADSFPKKLGSRSGTANARAGLHRKQY